MQINLKGRMVITANQKHLQSKRNHLWRNLSYTGHHRLDIDAGEQQPEKNVG